VAKGGKTLFNDINKQATKFIKQNETGYWAEQSVIFYFLTISIKKK
jgi:hypothetical protein